MSAAVESASFVSVYVNGDGNDWSCTNSQLFKIPTELFDYHMLIGQLETREDLQNLIDKIANEKIVCPEDAYTNVYVQPNGSWSGVPSNCFQIPSHIFSYLLERGDTEKTLGRLYTQRDLERLIEKISKEIETGIIIPSEIVTTRTRPLNIEVKLCGHECTISSLKETCCSCGDKRPLQEENTYIAYVDGEGYTNSCSRGAGYCPNCFY